MADKISSEMLFSIAMDSLVAIFYLIKRRCYIYITIQKHSVHLVDRKCTGTTSEYLGLW